jgi:hypothetical protein
MFHSVTSLATSVVLALSMLNCVCGGSWIGGGHAAGSPCHPVADHGCHSGKDAPAQPSPPTHEHNPACQHCQSNIVVQTSPRLNLLPELWQPVWAGASLADVQLDPLVAVPPCGTGQYRLSRPPPTLLRLHCALNC